MTIPSIIRYSAYLDLRRTRRVKRVQENNYYCVLVIDNTTGFNMH